MLIIPGAFVFQETYPQDAPIWYSESDHAQVLAAVENLCDMTHKNNNVKLYMNIGQTFWSRLL